MGSGSQGTPTKTAETCGFDAMLGAVPWCNGGALKTDRKGFPVHLATLENYTKAAIQRVMLLGAA